MADEKESVCGSGRGNSCHRFGWVFNWMVVFAACGLLIGCTTIKTAGVTALAAAGGATVATEVMMSSSSKEKVMTDCAPDNFWSMLGSLIEMGGWALILIFLLPIVIGWVLPGPTKLNRK